MQSPSRPWENGSLNRFSTQHSAGYSTMIPSGNPLLHSSSPNTPIRMGPSLGQAASNSQQPPPLPRRAPATSNINQSSYLRSRIPVYGPSSPYGGLTGSYGSYGSYGGYGGYGGLGGLGSYGLGGYGGFNSYGGYGMNRYGGPNPNDPENRFIQLAEESSRPAFQSIESLVQAFHSVSMMLDSTFNAVYMSFRAVLGVAENFGRLRGLLGQFFSSVALFRALIWLYKKVLYLLGLRRENPSQDHAWQTAMQAVGEDIATSTGRPRSSWPILMFMGIVFSGPYLIFKLMSSLSSSVEENQTVPRAASWNPEQMAGTPAVALYGFTARSEDELSFYPGQRVTIAPVTFQRKDLQAASTPIVPEQGLTANSSNTPATICEETPSAFHENPEKNET